MMIAAVCASTLALGVATANAVLVSLGTFGSQGSGAGQFQTPVGVAVAPTSGNVYVADSGNARVEVFGPKGNFIAAWGWGVTDGKAQSEVCTANCQAGIPGSGAGQFSNPTSIAAAGNRVYVGDAGNNVVLVFDPSGGFLATIDGTASPQGHFVTVAGVAVDQSGNLWVADGSSDFISEYNSKRKFLQQWQDPFGQTIAITVDATNNAVYLIRGAQTTERFTLTGGNETVIDNGTGVALGLDQNHGILYVDHGGDVAIYDKTGTQIDSLSLSPTTNSQGLAFAALTGGSGKPGQGNLYVTDAGNDNVTIYGPPPPGPPFITAESEEGTGPTTATLHATIVPAGFDTTCVFQYVANDTFQVSGYDNATSVPCTPADLGSSFTYQQASADISGLTTGAFYHFRAVATNSAGTTTGADKTFQAGPGDWTAFNRCPVDDPAMLGTDGVNELSICVTSNSTHGSITLGTAGVMTVTGNSNLQIGSPANINTGIFQTIGPTCDGAVIADPVTVTVGGQTAVATLESAGAPSDFNLGAGISQGTPIITLPVKIHLVAVPPSVDLGPSCFIGSEQDPIVLHPENTDLSGASLFFENFDPGGTPNPSGPLVLLRVSGLVQGDDTFAVPGASGCGPNGDGSLNNLVNAVVGLPSPSGMNHLVLSDATSSLALPASGLSGSGTPLTGQDFAADWHIAFGNPTCTVTTTTTTTSTTATTTTTTASTTSTSAASTTTTTTGASTTTTGAATTTTTTEAPIQCCVPGSPGGAFTCVVETATQCASAGGSNAGPGTCSPNPCGSTTTSPPTTTTTVTTTTTAPSTTTTTAAPTTTTTTTTAAPTTTTTTSTTSTTTTTTAAPTTTTTTSTTTTTTTPQPTTLDFANLAPGGVCGTAMNASNTVVKNLTCGGLNIGGGSSLVPEGPTPDGSQSRFNLSCSGSACNISAFSTAPALNSTDPDCSNTGCNFGTPLPIPNGSLSTCVLNTFQSPASGTLDLSTGASSTNVALVSDVYLTGNAAQPCPRCSASGSPSSPGTGTCDRGPRAGLTCVTTNSNGYTRDCLTGGADATHPCTVGGGNCLDGSHVGPINVNLSPLTTGTSNNTVASGLFCPSQPHAGCFGQTTCVSITENGTAAGSVSPGVPASGTLASVFCIAATGNGLVDATADLPGPGAVSLPGQFVVH